MGVTQRGVAPVETPHSPSADASAESARSWWSRPRAEVAGMLFVGAVVAAGVVARFSSDAHLWLDEALSVHIAALPLGDIPEALRHDGHPPLYYVLLHGWMELFGDGPIAVRALSGVFSVAMLPLAWLAGRRIGGPRAAWAAVLLLALNPYAIKYATETRMYSLVMTFVLAGWLVLGSTLRRSSPLRLAALAVLSGVLLLTQYWALYLLAAVGLVLAVRAWRARDAGDRRRALTAMAAIAAGGLAFLPWLPSFLYQVEHTGTPWAEAIRPTAVAVITMVDFGGGTLPETHVLALLLAGFVLLGLFGRPVDDHRIELDVRTRPELRRPMAVLAVTMVLAVAASYAASTAFASRYASIVFPLYIVAAGYGLTRFTSRKVLAVLAVACVALGGAGAARVVTETRTQAGEIAAGLREQAADGDVVAFCPDQLGPGVARAGLPPGVSAVAYPTFGPVDRVDWVDYEARNQAADPTRFAEELLARAGPDRDVFLVFTSGYRTLGTDCEQLNDALAAARPSDAIVRDRPTVWEHAWLLRYPAPQ